MIPRLPYIHTFILSFDVQDAVALLQDLNCGYEDFHTYISNVMKQYYSN